MTTSEPSKARQPSSRRRCSPAGGIVAKQWRMTKAGGSAWMGGDWQSNREELRGRDRSRKAGLQTLENFFRCLRFQGRGLSSQPTLFRRPRCPQARCPCFVVERCRLRKVILKHDLIRLGEQRLQICGLNKSSETKGCNEFHAGALNAANRTGLPQSLDRQIQLGGSG